jgi:GNAT superfamily N-acetyltransferase
MLRVTERRDLEQLYNDVLWNFYQVMPYNKLSKEKATDYWVNQWHNLILMGSGAIFAFKKEQEFTGTIGLLFHPSLEDGVLMCTETFWYVNEDQRGQGLKLLFKAEKFAKEMGAKRFIMGYLQNSMPQKVKNLYERLNYNNLQTAYMKEL